jgi:hypothetical protein
MIAIVACFSVVATAVFILRFGSTGMRALLATGTFGLLTVAGWLITFVAGPVAAVQLFRVRPSGRFAAAVLFGSMLVYYVVGIFVFRQPQAPAGPIITLCVFLGALIVIVLSPSAKRACTM